MEYNFIIIIWKAVRYILILVNQKYNSTKGLISDRYDNKHLNPSWGEITTAGKNTPIH